MILNYLNWSLRSKILFAAVIPFVMAVILILPILTHNSIEHIESKARLYADELAYGVSLEIKLRLNRYTQAVRMLADMIGVLADQNALSNDLLNQFLASQVSSYPSVTAVWISVPPLPTIKNAQEDGFVFWKRDSKGEIISEFTEEERNAIRVITKLIPDNKSGLITTERLSYDKINTHNFIFVSYPVYNKKGERIGAIGISINGVVFNKILEETKGYGAELATLVTPAGIGIANSTTTLSSVDAQLPTSSKLKLIQERLATSDEYASQYKDARDREIYDIYTPVQPRDIQGLWLLRVVYPIESVYREIYRQLLIVVIIAIVCVVLGISVSLVTARNISRPIRQISTALESVAEGDFNAAIPQIRYRDEVGQIASSATVLKRYAQEMVIAKQEAVYANASKSEFLANMSHELRTPMHAVLSYAKLGLERIEDKESKLYKYLTNIYRSGERLLSLLNDLLDLAKLESGRIDFQFVDGDINGCIESAISELQPLMYDKKLHITFTPLSTQEPIVFDYEKISQVVINLLSNAIKFSPGGGKVEVKVERCGGDIAITVADEGVGVPEEELEMIFNKFTQSSKTNKGTGGTGLGLSIAKNIIMAHNGRIWCANKEPHGAIFTITLPIMKRNDSKGQEGQ